MAHFTLQNAFSNFLTLVAFFSLFQVTPSSCYNSRKFLNISIDSFSLDWSPAIATWYGSPDGAGSDGGACGYGSAVSQPPFSKYISAGGPAFYNSGKGCGTCYQVKCTANSLCSGQPVTVVITDECPECQGFHFDLSGTAFGAMALPSQADLLRKVGKMEIQHRRVECNYPGTSIAFKVDSGSNQYYMAIVIEYEDGDGELSNIELKESSSSSSSWRTMQRSWGALWKLDSPSSPIVPPLSFRLTAHDGKTVEANAILPADWKAGQIYRSVVNFPPN